MLNGLRITRFIHPLGNLDAATTQNRATNRRGYNTIEYIGYHNSRQYFIIPVSTRTPAYGNS